MTDNEPRQEFKFDVFISYRHADLDNAVASYLQKALEHYHVPREIQKKCGKKSIHRVFRDEEELGAASDLFSQIEENLKQSEFLVVICSPRILESKWCMREIETFIKYRGRDNILPVLIEGEPDSAFPPLLLEEGEPLAADLRGKDKREVLRHARERMPRLAAPLLYCSYDELFQRHRVYRMRRMLALAGLVTAVSLAFGAVTLMQSREIQKNYQAKLENQFRHLAQTATELQDGGDRDTALLVALEALPRSSEDTSRPYVAEARIALERALYTYSRDLRYQLRPLKRLEHREEIGSIIDRNDEENVLLTTDAGYIYIWDGETCGNICCQAYSGELKDAKLTGDQGVAVMTETGAYCFDYQTGHVLWQWEYPACTNEYCSAPSLLWAYDQQSGQILCANKYLCLHKVEGRGDAEIAPGHAFYLVDAATGQSRAWVPGTLYDFFEGDAYTAAIYLEDDCFILSPGGARTAVMIQPPAVDETAVLTVFSTGEDESIYTKAFTREISLENFVEEAIFLDEDHLAVVCSSKGGATLGLSGKSAAWELECWNVETGELRMSYQDTCLCLNNRTSIKRFVPPDGDQSEAILSVTYDNVAVNLDWASGERLARIEDRSAIALNHFFSATSELIVTADGYLFATLPTDDIVWAPVYNAYHYYIGLSQIERSEWLDGKAFFFTATGVYCYTPAMDESCTYLEGRPDEVAFTTDSSRLLVGCQNDKIYFFDGSDFSLRWEDDYCSSHSSQASALLDDRWAAYLTGDGTVLKFRALQDGSVQEVRLDGFTPDLAGNGAWSLRAAGSGAVLVWNANYITFSADEERRLEDTALWLVDAEKGTVAARWSYQDICGQFSEQFSLNQLTLRMDTPAASANARYVLFPCCLTGYQEDDPGWDNQVEVQRVLEWDLETGEALALPDEIQQGMAWQLAFLSYFQQDGWISPTESAAVFYNEERRLLQVVDLASGELLHELEADGITSREVSFTPDGDHLIFQDPQRRICVYDWKQGKYTMHGATSEIGCMQFAFHQGGQVLSATYKAGGMTSETTMIYQRMGDGVYKLETSVSRCGDCDGKTVVINDDQYPRLYHAYTLDELLATAQEILDGRELTELERKSYLID